MVEQTSSRLAIGSVYTREELKKLFSIADATINTGVFQPKGTSSVWLFVTEEKTADRTQYLDRYDGDLLRWQGQTSSRSDHKIIGHASSGLELLVFLRKRKYEHPGAGFRYLGPFDYVSHAGHGPASFVLRRSASGSQRGIAADAASGEAFDPTSVVDARKRVERTITERRGQQAFRDGLMVAYGGRCAITGCDVRDVLEAAHIYPYRGADTNTLSNGLLLGADIHTLFDCELIAIDPHAMTVIVAPGLLQTEYAVLQGAPLRRPIDLLQSPNQEALAMHRRGCGF